MWNWSGFANWGLLKLGFYPPSDTGRQGSYLLVLAATNSKKETGRRDILLSSEQCKSISHSIALCLLRTSWAICWDLVEEDICWMTWAIKHLMRSISMETKRKQRLMVGTEYKPSFWVQRAGSHLRRHWTLKHLYLVVWGQQWQSDRFLIL